MGPQHVMAEEDQSNRSSSHNNSVSLLAEPLLGPNNDSASVVSAASGSTNAAPTFAGLLFFRSLFFLNGLSASTWGRFGIIFYNKVVHLSPLQIGILQGLMPLLSFFAMPCWGLVADWIQSRKQVYMMTKFCGSAALLSLAVVKHRFHWILLSVSCMSIFRASGVLDAFVLDYLGDSHRGLYGTVRLWTAVSWGFGAMAMGHITDRFGFEWNFFLYGAMMLIMLLVVAFGLPARSKNEQARYEQATSDPAAPNHPHLSVLFRSLLQLPVLVWLIEVIVIGAGCSVVESFLFVYLQNELDASTRLCGMTVGVTVLIEIPIFQYSKQMLERVGHDALFAIAILAYVVRVFGYTFLTERSAYWVLALESLHGVTFACMWISSIDFAAAAAPPEWSTTFQTILSACFACFGNVLGSILGGWAYEQYSAVAMYRGMGWIVTAVLGLHLFLWLVAGRGHDKFLADHQRRREEESEASTTEDEQNTSSPDESIDEEDLGDPLIEEAV